KINGQPVDKTNSASANPAGAGAGSAGGAASAGARGAGREMGSPSFQVGIDLAHDQATIALHPADLQGVATPNGDASQLLKGPDRPLAMYSHWSVYRYNAPPNTPAQPTPKPPPTEDDTDAEVPRAWLQLDCGQL